MRPSLNGRRSAPSMRLTRIIAGAGVPCGAVLTTLELLHDPDLHKRGMMQKIEHPVRGPVIVPGWPLRMSDSKVPAEMRPDSRRGFRGDLWRVARLLPRRGQGHAARQCDLRTAILAARGNFANFAACVAVVMLLCSDDLLHRESPEGFAVGLVVFGHLQSPLLGS